MPLSEEENRLLEQMEQALAAEDPKFASTLRGSSLERVTKIRTLGAVIVFVVGMGMLLGGAMAAQTWLGILGFVVMLGSATVGLAAWRGRRTAAHHAGEQPGPDPFAVPGSAGTARFDVIDGGRSHPSRGSSRNRSPGRASGRGQRGRFLQRMEQRWERRRRQGY